MFDKDNEESSDQLLDEESSDQLDESANEGDQEEIDQPDEQESDLVEINGERVSLEELKKGYMRESDYRKKTQELGAMRREIEGARAARVDAGGDDEYTPEEKQALKALEKLGVAKRSEVEDIVRSMLARQQIMSERERVKIETGLGDDLLDAAQFMAVRNGITLTEAASRLAGQKKVIKKKSISVNGGTGSSASTQRSSLPTPEEIRKMDPNSKEFAKVVKMMEDGEL